MKIVLVDDEPIAISILENYIRQVEGLALAGSCRNAIETFNLLQHTKVDLLLLDIEMPGINGLNLIKSLQEPPIIILTTAYREYALDGFELGVADYLLKPIAFERFLKAVQKVQALNSRIEEPKNLFVRPYVYFKSAQKMVQVFLDEVLYVESLSNYVRIFLSNGTSVVTYLRMTDLTNRLPESDFLRIHRSYIVRRDKISTFTPHTVEIGGKEIPIGGQYRERVLATINPISLEEASH